ncbi:hypothetical protein ACFWD7_53775 [Streptomyces mirabilis]|uniref:hypothetical protein n=1 Tax=Streptomyces mirabilis TaxID=68239 RepID=UPI0036C06B11
MAAADTLPSDTVFLDGELTPQECSRITTKKFLNLYVGHLTLEHTDLWPASEAGARMVTYTRKDDGTRERLERVHEIARGS